MSLTPKARRILELIAEGHSYDQILDTDETLTYNDIFGAAKEALGGIVDLPTATEAEVVEIPPPGDPYSRTGLELTMQEREELARLARAGFSPDRIGTRMERHPAEIERLIREHLGAIEEVSEADLNAGDRTLTARHRNAMRQILHELYESHAGEPWMDAGESAEELLDTLILMHSFHRRERSFTLADHIRAELEKIGIMLIDEHEKETQWRKF